MSALFSSKPKEVDVPSPDDDALKLRQRILGRGGSQSTVITDQENTDRGSVFSRKPRKANLSGTRRG